MLLYASVYGSKMRLKETQHHMQKKVKKKQKEKRKERNWSVCRWHLQIVYQVLGITCLNHLLVVS